MQSIEIIIMLILGLAVLAVVHITQIKSKIAIKKTNNRLECLFENMQEGFALHEIICNEEGNPIDYKFLNVNKSFEKITGLKAGEIINRTVKQVMPDTENYWIEKYGEVALHGEAEIFSNYASELDKYFNVSVYSPEKMKFVTIFTDVSEQIKAKDKIEREVLLFENILENTMSGYWDRNLAEQTNYFSPSLLKMVGYESDEPISRNFWKERIYKEDIINIVNSLRNHIKSHGEIPFYTEVRYYHKDGSTVWVYCSGKVIEWGKNNQPLRIVGCHINITDLKKIELLREKEKNIFQTTLHSLGDGVISTDRRGKVDIMNAVAERLTGWTVAEAKGAEFYKIFETFDSQTGKKCDNFVEQVFSSGKIIQLEDYVYLITKNGQKLPIEDSVAPILDEKGNISGAVIVFRDFTEKKQRQEEILYLSYHDQLTGLYNRRFFEEELKRLDTARNIPFTIAMADVNGLKLINDAFGHLAGDELLRRISNVLKKECREDDIVARIGGDEFVIMLPKTTSEETELIVKRIYEAVAKEQMENIVLSISIGWDTKLQPDNNIADIFARAEENMYHKKLLESQSMRNKTIQMVLDALNAKTKKEKIHSERVSAASKRIGEAMHLNSELIKELEIAGLLHDIGKITISESILNMQGVFTETEYSEIKRHPENSYQILKSVDAYSSFADSVLSHHERWDGLGYPRGLAGEEIPIIARIIMIADAYVAMTSNRIYKKVYTKDEALEELCENAGIQFDADIVKICIENEGILDDI